MPMFSDPNAFRAGQQYATQAQQFRQRQQATQQSFDFDLLKKKASMTMEALQQAKSPEALQSLRDTTEQMSEQFPLLRDLFNSRIQQFNVQQRGVDRIQGVPISGSEVGMITPILSPQERQAQQIGQFMNQMFPGLSGVSGATKDAAFTAGRQQMNQGAASMQPSSPAVPRQPQTPQPQVDQPQVSPPKAPPNGQPAVSSQGNAPSPAQKVNQQFDFNQIVRAGTEDVTEQIGTFGGGSVSRTTVPQVRAFRNYMDQVRQQAKADGQNPFSDEVVVDMVKNLPGGVVIPDTIQRSQIDPVFNRMVQKEKLKLMQGAGNAAQRNIAKKDAVRNVFEMFGGNYISKLHEKALDPEEVAQFQIDGKLQQGLAQIVSREDYDAASPEEKAQLLEQASFLTPDITSKGFMTNVDTGETVAMFESINPVTGDVRTFHKSLNGTFTSVQSSADQLPTTKTRSDIEGQAGSLNNLVDDVRRFETKLEGLPDSDINALIGPAGALGRNLQTIQGALEGIASRIGPGRSIPVAEVADRIQKAIPQGTLGSQEQALFTNYMLIVLSVAASSGLGAGRALTDEDIEIAKNLFSAGSATQLRGSLSEVKRMVNDRSRRISEGLGRIRSDIPFEREPFQMGGGGKQNAQPAESSTLNELFKLFGN